MTTIWRRTRKPPTRRLRLRRKTEDGGQNAERKCKSKTEIACGSTAGDLFWRIVLAKARRWGCCLYFVQNLRPQPHTSLAISTTIRSFAHCSSSASTLPSSVEAKPHCGERQS